MQPNLFSILQCKDSSKFTIIFQEMQIELEVYTENSRPTALPNPSNSLFLQADLECSDVTGYKSQRGFQLLTRPKAALGEAQASVVTGRQGLFSPQIL